jgi:hypothetical protein
MDPTHAPPPPSPPLPPLTTITLGGQPRQGEAKGKGGGREEEGGRKGGGRGEEGGRKGREAKWGEGGPGIPPCPAKANPAPSLGRAAKFWG